MKYVSGTTLNGSKSSARPIEGSRWLAGLVAFCSIALSIVLGVRVVPAAVSTDQWEHVPGHAVVTFLLSIALISLAWRRYADLKRSTDRYEAAEQRSRDLAYKDEVTSLYNRRHLKEVLSCRCSSSPVALLLIDLDHFKKVNDLYGHAAGDLLLFEIARRIQAGAPEALCARLGGDEFAVLISGADAVAERATEVAERLVAELNRPIQLDATLARVGASIGLSAAPAESLHGEELMRHADIAMYEAKRLGRNRFVWFAAEMESQLNRRHAVEAEMRESIAQGHFVPYFQPTLDLASGRVKGFEVLARWEHPTRGLLDPADFIPLADDTGLISDLSLAVMRSALTDTLSWGEDVTISVNISPVQFKDPLLAHRIVKLLNEVGFPAHRLELEITEGAIMENPKLALATISSLRNYGIRISLDDFGTGYASLSQLRELPFDRIKIDRGFVATLLDDEQSNAIVHAIAALGRSLRLPITAEGVEHVSMYRRLNELGCSDVQGWLFGRAMPAPEANKVLRGPTASDLELSLEGAKRKACG